MGGLASGLTWRFHARTGDGWAALPDLYRGDLTSAEARCDEIAAALGIEVCADLIKETSMSTIEFVGAASRLADIDLPRIGHRIGVGEDEVHAVIDVEARGGGFDAKRRPKLLFEPHVFYRNLSGARRAAAVKAGLAYKDWGQAPYPKDSYPRLAKAMAIDETAALRSASWGMGQILGENHVAAGYDTVQDMVRAFIEGGEAEHLDAMIRFIIANRLDDELRRHDWTGFARGYNGPQHAKHDYAGRLARAYAKWKKIRNTDWSPEDERKADVTRSPGEQPTSPPVPLPAEPRAPDIPPALIEATQARLRAKGYYGVGIPDGQAGDSTVGAVSKFQSVAQMPVTGQLDDATVARIWADDAPDAPVSERRKTITPEEVKAQPTEVAGAARAAGRGKLASVVAIGTSAVGGVFSAATDFFGDAWDKLAPIRAAAGDVPGWAWAGTAILVAYFCFYRPSQQAETSIVASVRKGETL